MSATMEVQEHIYDETFQMTGVSDFGFDMQSAVSGAKPIPPAGVRIDVSFEGELTGPRLKGKIAGTDYLLMRADGVTRLNVHAVITTDDGERIAFYADGVATVEGSMSQLRENVTLHTASAKYAWVNSRQFWATGVTDLTTGQAKLQGFSA